jgi:hypothetical protein
MQLIKQESRLVLAALHTLASQLADKFQPLNECSNLLIHPSFGAFHHHRRVLNLTVRLEQRFGSAETYSLDVSEAEVITRGLNRYAELLADRAEQDEVGNDDFASPEQRGRECELKATARLLSRLKAVRPIRRSLRAVS